MTMAVWEPDWPEEYRQDNSPPPEWPWEVAIVVAIVLLVVIIVRHII